MLGISKKRFLVTLVLSIFIFFFSVFIQIYDFEDWKLEGFLNLSSCSQTGYPIKICLYNSSQGLVFSIGLINIAFWFLVINFLYSLKKILIAIVAFSIWLVTVVIQKQMILNSCFGDVSWFRITGYPIAECVSKQDKNIIFTVYLVNILFWFLLILIIYKLIGRIFYKK